MTFLIIVAVLIYLFILFCLVLYHNSEEFEGSRRLNIFQDIFWPVTIPFFFLFVGIVKLVRWLTGYEPQDGEQ